MVDAGGDGPAVGRGVVDLYFATEDDAWGEMDGAGNGECVAVEEAWDAEWVELVDEFCSRLTR